MSTDAWLALTAIGTLALAGATVSLGWQSRGAVRLSREQAVVIADQTKAVREQTAIAREELEEIRRRDRPVLLWDQGEARQQFMWAARSTRSARACRCASACAAARPATAVRRS